MSVSKVLFPLTSQIQPSAIRRLSSQVGGCGISPITHADRRVADIAKKYLPGINPYKDLEGFLKKAAIASHRLPEALRSSLYDFKRNGNETGYFLIRTLPSDKPLMDTPQKLDEVPSKKETFHSEFWLSSIGSLLGEPFSYMQENGGNLFHNVRPAKEKADKLSSESSKALLDLHSETAFHPFYPDYLLLYCLRGDRDKQAKTIVSSLNAVKDKISPELVAALRRPEFRTGIDFSFGNTEESKGNGPVIPILYGDKQNPLIIFDPDLMVGTTEEAQKAIGQLKQLLDVHKEGVLLEEGDLLVVDNHRALHGRNQFKAYYDGKDRWLQRIYVTESLLRAHKMLGKKERVITYTFSNSEQPKVNV